MAENRLLLFGIELEEQAEKVAIICGLAIASVATFFMSLTSIICVIVLSVPEEERVNVFWWVAGICFGIFILAIYFCISLIGSLKGAFSQSIREFKRERQLIKELG